MKQVNYTLVNTKCTDVGLVALYSFFSGLNELKVIDKELKSITTNVKLFFYNEVVHPETPTTILDTILKYFDDREVRTKGIVLLSSTINSDKTSPDSYYVKAFLLGSPEGDQVLVVKAIK